MLLLAGWLPSWALAFWQERRRRWRALLASDLLAAGLLVLLAVTIYLPLFFVNVVWFLPLALLPRGLCTELLWRRSVGRRTECGCGATGRSGLPSASKSGTTLRGRHGRTGSANVSNLRSGDIDACSC